MGWAFKWLDLHLEEKNDPMYPLHVSRRGYAYLKIKLKKKSDTSNHILDVYWPCIWTYSYHILIWYRFSAQLEVYVLQVIGVYLPPHSEWISDIILPQSQFLAKSLSLPPSPCTYTQTYKQTWYALLEEISRIFLLVFHSPCETLISKPMVQYSIMALHELIYGLDVYYAIIRCFLLSYLS